MTTPMTSNNAPRPHGQARYRTTAHGLQVVIPTRCPSGRHVLSTDGCRIYETGTILHVTCRSCAGQSIVDHTWSLTTHGRKALSAEFDDQPYHSLLRTAP
ncbi:hypothetical protein [Kibdelosporangium persicum]|uniref:hypothetical protein n=1 Tax=Kibdelosporangium persicum TaxID=2698649 RepID=UPI0015648A0F|nr:hypothetical protein [Kibdelosporangium persicum]